MSAYKAAIDKTKNLIDTRANYYRNLIVAVVALSLGSLGWAVVTWTVAPFAGLALFVPVCGLFFFLDDKLLSEWRAHLVDAWVKKDIDLQGLSAAVTAIPTLPQDTLRSMLATLPNASDLIAEQGISSSTREAVAAAVAEIHGCQSDSIVLKTAGATILSTSVVMASARRAWEPLLANVALLMLPVLGQRLKRRRAERLERSTTRARMKADFSPEKYHELLARLQSEPILDLETDHRLDC